MASKNAILIVEFARKQREEEKKRHKRCRWNRG
jgi:multidrug efflux pump subunit AcrB